MSDPIRILIVEDEEAIRESVSLILKEEFPGVAILEAKNGHDALQKINASNPHQLPDLVILDLLMPLMDGTEFITKANAANLDLNILILTVKTNVITNYPCITKPFDIDELIRKVRECLKNK